MHLDLISDCRMYSMQRIQVLCTALSLEEELKSANAYQMLEHARVLERGVTINPLHTADVCVYISIHLALSMENDGDLKMERKL